MLVLRNIISWKILLAPLGRRYAKGLSEGPGETKLIRISYGFSHILDSHACELEKLGSLGHAVLEEQLLRTKTDMPLHKLAQVAAADAAESGDVFHRNIIVKILFNKVCGFFDIGIGQPFS